MSTPRQDLVTYCNCLEEVKRRVAVGRSITRGHFSTGQEDLDAEIVCLQLRKSLELVAFASLSANRALYMKVRSDVEKAWSANRILKTLQRVHPDFYPRPIRLGREDEAGVKHFEDVKDSFLTRDDYVVIYDKCSQVIHAWNPHRTGPKHVDFDISLDAWLGRLEKLLELHYFKLPEDAVVHLAYLSYPPDGKAHVLTGEPRAG